TRTLMTCRSGIAAHCLERPPHVEGSWRAGERSLVGQTNRALGEHTSKVRAVLLAGVNVGIGIDGRADRVGRRRRALEDAAADQQGLRLASADWYAANAGQHDAGGLDAFAAEAERDGHTGQREIAVTTGELEPR